MATKVRSIRMPEELWNQLDTFAAQRGTTANALLGEAVRVLLSDTSGPQPSFGEQTLPEAARESAAQSSLKPPKARREAREGAKHGLPAEKRVSEPKIAEKTAPETEKRDWDGRRQQFTKEHQARKGKKS